MTQKKRKRTRETRDPYTGLPSTLLEEMGVDENSTTNISTNSATGTSRKEQRKQNRIQKKVLATKARQDWRNRNISSNERKENKNIGEDETKTGKKRKRTPKSTKDSQQTMKRNEDGKEGIPSEKKRRSEPKQQKNRNGTTDVKHKRASHIHAEDSSEEPKPKSKKPKKNAKKTTEQDQKEILDDPDKKEIKRLERLLGIDKKRKRKEGKGKTLNYDEVFEEGDDALLDLLKFCDKDTRSTAMDPQEVQAMRKAERANGTHPSNGLQSNGNFSANSDESESEGQDFENSDEDFDIQQDDDLDPEENFDDELDDENSAECDEIGEQEQLPSESENEHHQSVHETSAPNVTLDDDSDDSEHESQNGHPGESNASMHISFDRNSNGLIVDHVNTEPQNRKISKPSQKYVPPSQRKKISIKQDTLKRRVRGLLNRVADVNASGIAEDLVKLLQTATDNASGQELATWYANLTLNSVRDGSGLAYVNPYVRAHAAIASHVAVHVDYVFLASLISSAVRRIQTELNSIDNPHDSFPENENEEPNATHAYGYVALVCGLYEQKAVSCHLLYSLIRYLATRFDTVRLGLLLALLRQSGPQLRIDDPTSLKDIIDYILEKAKPLKGKTTDDGSDVKLQIVLDLIGDIATNRVKKSTVKGANAQFSWAQTPEAPLSGSISDLLDDHFVGTQWWLPSGGATQHGNSANISNDIKRSTTKQNSDTDLRSLATSLRLNTEFRKSVFMVIMSSTNVRDAIDRLENLGGFDRKNSQDKDTALVLIHCCCAEKVFNPFYSYLSIKFCQRSRNCRFTFEFFLRDFLKLLRDEKNSNISQRKQKVLSQLLVHLWEAGVLSLSVLRQCDDFIECAEEEKSFYRMTLNELLKRLSTLDKVEEKIAIFKKITNETWTGAGAFCISLAVFFRRELCNVENTKESELAMKAVRILESKVQN